MGILDNIGQTYQAPKATSGAQIHTGNASAADKMTGALIKQDHSLQKLALKLGLGLDQLNNIIQKYPNFVELNEIEQHLKIQEFYSNEENIENVSTGTSLTNDIKAEFPDVFDNEGGILNTEKLKSLTVEKQVELYKYALAQNQNRANWNNLDDKQRAEIIKNLDLGDFNLCKSDDSKLAFLKQNIPLIMTANEYNTNIDQVTQGNINEFTGHEDKLQADVSNALIEYYATHPEELNNLDSDLYDNMQEKVKYYEEGYRNQGLCVEEIEACLAKINTTRPDGEKFDSAREFLYEHVQAKTVDENGNEIKDLSEVLTAEELERLNEGKFYKTANIILSTVKPHGSFELESFNKSPYAAMLRRDEQIQNNSNIDGNKLLDNNEAKAKIYNEYIEEVKKSGGDILAAQTAANLANELREKDPDLAHKIIEIAILDPGIQTELSKMKDLPTVTDLGGLGNKLNKNNAINLAETVEAMYVEADEMEKKTGKPNKYRENIEQVEAIIIDNVDDEHHAWTSGVWSGSKSLKTQKINADRTLKYENAELQLEASRNIKNNSHKEIKTYFAVNIPETKKENQVILIKEFGEEKDINNAMIDAGVQYKVHEDNQVEAYKTIRARVGQSDYTPEEQEEQSKKLTDDVQNCAAQNQQAIYEDLMQSSNEAAAQYAKQAYETRYTPVENSSSSVNSASNTASSSNYQTSPFESKFADFYSTAANVQNTPDFSSTEAKSVYEQFLSGEVSVTQASDSFNKLTLAEKQEVLKSLPKSELLKMPVSVCELCPEFIPEFVDAHRGLEVLNKVASSTNTVIACMKKKMVSDPEIRKQFRHIAATNPWMLSKASQMAAGVETNRPTKSLELRG